MTYKAIIADDEKELRGYLKTMLAEAWPELAICGEAANGRETLEMIDACQPHIIFLDIKMPGLSGLDVAQKIADECRIVFVTAYNQYAVEAFEHEAIDYLVKPVTKKRLMQTILRLKKELQNNEAPSAGLAAMLSQVIASLPSRSGADFLRWIKAQHKEAVRLIPVEEVDYFQADDKYTLVITADGESLIKKSIKELSQELDPHRFWQIHRSTIVNVSKIEHVGRSLTGRGVLKLKNRPDPLTVSRQYLHLFKQM
ncbi:MAG: DNA-binding response regulator [Deltaproteobacteria bacterium HGW-Deltaproteobacteria-6]|jgi:DNA-binding LytR/AlgR family response regulator|nr:MAG: DNA-binding response regulator [Deltaproteobacteria bacterium HGW-Deltaproteobacteria-6]